MDYPLYNRNYASEILTKLETMESMLSATRQDAKQLFDILKEQVTAFQNTLESEHEVCLTEAVSRFDVHTVILDGENIYLQNEFEGHVTKLLFLPCYARFLMSAQKSEHPKTIGFVFNKN